MSHSYHYNGEVSTVLELSAKLFEKIVFEKKSYFACNVSKDVTRELTVSVLKMMHKDFPGTMR